MRYTYTVDGIRGLGARGAAFTPAPPPVTVVASLSSDGIRTRTVTGFLNQWFASPRAAAIPTVAASSNGRQIQPGQMIDAWNPDVYVERPDPTFGRLVPNRHREDLPVPAGDPNGGSPTGRPTRQAKPHGVNRTMGRKVVAWPRAFQRFPARLGVGNDGSNV